MSKLARMKRDRLSGRSIKVEAFVTDDGAVLVEGTLEDVLHTELHPWSWETVQVGPIHRMVMRMLLDHDQPRILEAEAQVLQGPVDVCPEVEAPVKKLVGLLCGPGYVKAVKDRIGATNGCAHLTALALDMGAAGLQGWVINKRRKALPPEMIKVMIQPLKNSCHAWREDAPLFHEVLATIEGMKTDDE